MGQRQGYRADDINRSERPDKNKNRNINRQDDDSDVSNQRGRKGDRGKRHDKENMEDENE